MGKKKKQQKQQKPDLPHFKNYYMDRTEHQFEEIADLILGTRLDILVMGIATLAVMKPAEHLNQGGMVGHIKMAIDSELNHARVMGDMDTRTVKEILAEQKVVRALVDQVKIYKVLMEDK